MTDALDTTELEAERDFLLRSLDDLDSELVAGNIDPDTYRELHDDYTARAAAVIKQIESGAVARQASEVRGQRATRYVTWAGIVVFIGLAVFLLARSFGDRTPGQTATGNNAVNGRATPATQPTSTADMVKFARAAAERDPQNYDARLAYARTLVQARDLTEAAKQYANAARLDPQQAEPLAYGGWVTAQLTQLTNDASIRRTLLDTALELINHAITVQPEYADSYVFKALVLSGFENKPCDAVPAFQRFLVLAPTDHPMRSQVADALAGAIKAGKCVTANTVKP